jgi:hypothetical protein
MKPQNIDVREHFLHHLRVYTRLHKGKYPEFPENFLALLEDPLILTPEYAPNSTDSTNVFEEDFLVLYKPLLTLPPFHSPSEGVLAGDSTKLS